MAERLVTVREIAAKILLHPDKIYTFIYEGRFPAHVPGTYPHKYRVSEVNKWIIAYGSERISLTKVSNMLRLKWSAIRWFIERGDFPEAINTTGEPECRRIQIINWKRKHPGYRAFVKKNMRSNR